MKLIHGFLALILLISGVLQYIVSHDTAAAIFFSAAYLIMVLSDLIEAVQERP